MAKAKLILRIADADYRVTLTGPTSVTVSGLNAYDLAVADGRVTCTCGDYVHRQAATPSGQCKHGVALLQVGLLDLTKAPHVKITENPTIGLDPGVSPDCPPA